MRRISRVVLLLGSTVGLVACGPEVAESPTGGDLDYVYVRTWPTPSSPEEFPEAALGWLMERPSFGIAFSGGGTRSAAATLGQLRALHSLRWLALDLVVLSLIVRRGLGRLAELTLGVVGSVLVPGAGPESRPRPLSSEAPRLRQALARNQASPWLHLRRRSVRTAAGHRDSLG